MALGQLANLWELIAFEKFPFRRLKGHQMKRGWQSLVLN